MRNLRPVSETRLRAVIYLRQSTYKEESISLEMQELACRDYCDRMGYDVVAVKEDPGISGRTWKRRGVQDAMDLIASSRADVIVLWKWSRLSRNRKDWALAIDMTDVAGGRIESATEPIDTATASGRFARGVMTEFSAYQSELIGEVWEEVRQRRLRLGLPASGRLPFGWRWIEGGIEADEEKTPYIVEMYRRYLGGEGAASIARWLNEEGVPGPNGKPWTRIRPLTVLDSPIHAGLIPYRDHVYPGAHEGIISEATRDAYLAERARRRDASEKPRSYTYMLSAIVRCECGARMHGKGAITAGKWYGGYICSDTLNGHEQRAYVSCLSLEPPVVEWLMQFDAHAVTESRDDTVRTLQRDRLLRELNELEDELASLTRQHLRGIVTEASYVRTRNQIQQEMEPKRDEVRQLIAAERQAPSAEQIATLRAQWDEMTTSEKNEGIRQVIDRIAILPGGTGAEIHTTWGPSSVVTF